MHAPALSRAPLSLSRVSLPHTQEYEVLGEVGAAFNLITSARLSLNAMFIEVCRPPRASSFP